MIEYDENVLAALDQEDDFAENGMKRTGMPKTRGTRTATRLR